MIVADFMTPDPFCVHRDEPLIRIMEAFRSHGVFQIPVTDQFNRLVGVISERDIRAAIARDEGAMHDARVCDIMTPSPVTVAPSTPLKDAVQILSSSRFGGLPVVMGNRVVGMLTSRDLLQRFMTIIESRRSVDRVDIDFDYLRTLSGRV